MHETPRGNAGDKRDAERVPMLGELQGGIMMLEPMVIREISRAGAAIDTRFPLQINSIHDLRLGLGELTVVVKGRVVHSRISDVDQDVVTYRSGVEFIDVSDHAFRAIDLFLNTLEARRTGV
jgi:hypothetical protein